MLRQGYPLSIYQSFPLIQHSIIPALSQGISGCFGEYIFHKIAFDLQTLNANIAKKKQLTFEISGY